MLQAEIGDDFRLYAWAGLNLLPFNLTFIKYVGCIFIYQIQDLKGCSYILLIWDWIMWKLVISYELEIFFLCCIDSKYGYFVLELKIFNFKLNLIIGNSVFPSFWCHECWNSVLSLNWALGNIKMLVMKVVFRYK